MQPVRSFRKYVTKKRWAGTTLTAVLLLTAPACGAGGESAGVSEDSILIGAYAGTSGPVALTARDLVRGWRLGLSEVNANGGVNGRKIELIVRDDGYDPAQAVTVVRDLVQNDGVSAVTGLGSPTTLAVNEFLTAEEVPNLFPVSGASQLYEPPTKSTFIAQPTYTAQAYASVKYGAQQEGVTKLGILGLNDEAGQDVVEGCLAAAKEFDVEVVGRHTFEATTTDFTAQLNDLRSKGANGVCIANPLELTGLQLKQAERLNWDPVWMGFSSQANTALVDLAGESAAEGLIANTTFRPPGFDDPAVQEFVDAYRARYDGAAPSFFSQYGYWSAHLMADAVEGAGQDLTRESLREEILSWQNHKDSTGLSGRLTFSEEQPNGLNSLFIVQVRNGELVPVTGLQPVPEGF